MQTRARDAPEQSAALSTLVADQSCRVETQEPEVSASKALLGESMGILNLSVAERGLQLLLCAHLLKPAGAQRDCTRRAIASAKQW